MDPAEKEEKKQRAVLVAAYALVHPDWTDGVVRKDILKTRGIDLDRDFVRYNMKKKKDLQFKPSKINGRKRKLSLTSEKEIVKKKLKRAKMTPEKVANEITEEKHGFTVSGKTIRRRMNKRDNPDSDITFKVKKIPKSTPLNTGDAPKRLGFAKNGPWSRGGNPFRPKIITFYLTIFI